MTPSDCPTDMQAELARPIAQALRYLKTVDFELAYLALLTREGLKPLSRWEKSLEKPGLEALEQSGLQVRQVSRTVRTGKAFTETIFSRTPAYREAYASHFDNLPVDKSAETVRIEGFLFGYPPCCVAQYVRQPYAPNELPIYE